MGSPWPNSTVLCEPNDIYRQGFGVPRGSRFRIDTPGMGWTAVVQVGVPCWVDENDTESEPKAQRQSKEQEGLDTPRGCEQHGGAVEEEEYELSHSRP
jgi:hypothetical protein